MTITIQTTINAPLPKVWDAYSDPAAITQWNAASDDWCCPHAEVDLRPGGRTTSRMEARDGSMGFDFGGTYDDIQPRESLTVRMDDGRVYQTRFAESGGRTVVTTTFDPEQTHPAEMQRAGWQAILDRFRDYVEGRG